jgi:hypothetical protein
LIRVDFATQIFKEPFERLSFIGVDQATPQFQGGALGHFSKTDIRLWQDRLFRQTYQNNGHLHRTSHWSAWIQHEGLAGFGAFAFTV